MFRYFAVNLFGKRLNRICEPSNGGIGCRLNANKNTFRKTPYQRRSPTKEFPIPNIKNKMNSRDESNKLEKGPANETTASSLSGLLKLFLFTGTGLAQPINAKPDANAAKGIITDPIKSGCLSGFNVNLPEFFAVSSPNMCANNA